MQKRFFMHLIFLCCCLFCWLHEIRVHWFDVACVRERTRQIQSVQFCIELKSQRKDFRTLHFLYSCNRRSQKHHRFTFTIYWLFRAHDDTSCASWYRQQTKNENRRVEMPLLIALVFVQHHMEYMWALQIAIHGTANIYKISSSTYSISPAHCT